MLSKEKQLEIESEIQAIYDRGINDIIDLETLNELENLLQQVQKDTKVN